MKHQEQSVHFGAAVSQEEHSLVVRVRLMAGTGCMHCSWLQMP